MAKHKGNEKEEGQKRQNTYVRFITTMTSSSSLITQHSSLLTYS